MTKINPHIFRAYDIRGIAGIDLTPALVRDFGQIFADHVRDKSGKASPLIVVGRDGRLSSPELSQHLINGLAQGGADVVDVGLAPTPGLYFAGHHFNSDAGIMMTGSHNPSEYNGLKMTRAGAPVYGGEIQSLKERLADGRKDNPTMGTNRRESILEPYLERLLRDFQPGRDIRVVLDCGNGATGVVVPELLSRMPTVTGEILFAEVDGTFPNHHPDPTIPENLEALRQRMKETGAELGIAFDGDGDRIGALDETGRVVWGDRLMILFARQILAKRPGETIIGDVKCSQLLFDAVEKAGPIQLPKVLHLSVLQVPARGCPS